MPDDNPISARQFRTAARRAEMLDEFLSRAMTAKTMPLLIGFDLEFLASQFDDAADKMKADSHA